MALAVPVLNVVDHADHSRHEDYLVHHDVGLCEDGGVGTLQVVG